MHWVAEPVFFTCGPPDKGSNMGSPSYPPHPSPSKVQVTSPLTLQGMQGVRDALTDFMALQYLTGGCGLPPPLPLLVYVAQLNYNVSMHIYAYLTGHFTLRYSWGREDVPTLLAGCPRNTQVKFVTSRLLPPGWETALILIAGLRYPVLVLYSRGDETRVTSCTLHPHRGLLPLYVLGKRPPPVWVGGCLGFCLVCSNHCSSESVCFMY